MRISTNTLFDGGSARMGSLQTKLDRTMQQLGSGSKLLTTADDPVAAARVLEVGLSSASNDQHERNRTQLRNSLTLVDGAMSSMSDALMNINDQVTTAGNAVLSESEFSVVAQELQGQLDQLVSLANTRDGSGNYLFAGHQTASPPYAKDATTGAMTYQGDQGQQLLPLDGSRKMAMGEAGSVLFAKDQNGADIFTHLQAAISALQPGQPAATRSDKLSALRTSYADTFSSVTRSQASVGIRLGELDQLDVQGSDRALQYAEITSSLQDLDYNAAASDLARQQLALQAAQKSFQQVSNLSLFNYLN
ncbi:MAG: hypothetical protein RLZZ22_1726 [Pseudomonadota bacterium]|jgi:flagellar hook-associated protein 3 FlgL